MCEGSSRSGMIFNKIVPSFRLIGGICCPPAIWHVGYYNTNIYSLILRKPGRKPEQDYTRTGCSTPNKPSTLEMRYETRITN